MNQSDEFDDDDLTEMMQSMDEEGDRCRYRATSRMADECRRRAKEGRKFHAYVRSTFTLMNHAADLLRPDLQRDYALEIIALMEDDEQARRIQPDVSDELYEALRYQYTSCGYDNFAEGTAALSGYNSDGLHACIADGLQVCRRTGKSECIACFQDYATDVYLAADDLPMAFHFTRSRDMKSEWSKWSACLDEWRVLSLQGELAPALEAIRAAWAARHRYHTPHRAELRTRDGVVRTLALLGRLDEVPQFLTLQQGETALDQYDPHEYPLHHWSVRKTDAIQACCRGDYATALEILDEADATMRRQQFLSEWFDTRLQLMATLVLAGKTKRVASLADQLRPAAAKARDFLTLRRLDRLLDPATPPAPVAPAADLSEGPFANPARRVARTRPDESLDVALLSEEAIPANSEGMPSTPDGGENIPAEALDDDSTPDTPLGEFCGSIMAQLFAEEGDAEPDIPAIIRQIIAVPPDAVTDAGDGLLLMRLLGLAGLQCEDVPLLEQTLQWALEVKLRHAEQVEVACQCAALGSRFLEQLKSLGVDDQDWLDPRRIDDEFRELLDRAPQAPGVWAAAGMHFWSVGNEGEAERCFARAFRLDRKFSAAVLKLAELYTQSERPRDALAALDLSLREGNQDAEVAWQAALAAFGLKQCEATLTYLAKLDELAPGTPWANYYRAFSLVELGRAAEALEATERELESNPDATYPPLVLRAAALGTLSPGDEFRAALREVLATPLREVNYVTVTAIVALHRLLWLSASQLPADDPLRREYEAFVVAAGVAPDELLDAERKAGNREPQMGVNFYQVTLLVTVDADWPNQVFCRVGEEEWPDYQIYWGVLATDEDEALQLAIVAQQRGGSYPVQAVACDLGGEDFTDLTGVVWQGARQHVAATNDELAGDDDTLF